MSRVRRAARCVICCWGVVLLASVVSSGIGAEGQVPLSEEAVVAELGADGVQRATIILDSYSYSPNHLVVQAGKPVELTLTSVTFLIPHNFILNEPDAGLVVEEDVSAGDTETVRFTPTQPGTFVFYCDRKLWFFPSHREEGMEGRLEVKE